MREHERRRGHGGTDAAHGEERGGIGDVRLRLALKRRKAQRASERAAKDKANHDEGNARQQTGTLAQPDVSFSTAEAEEDAKEAGNLFSEDDLGEPAPGEDAARIRNPGFEDALFEGHEAGMEHAKPDGGGSELVEGAAYTVGKSSKLSGLTGGGHLPKPLVEAAEATEVILALKEGKYLSAFKKVAWAHKEQVGEALIYVAEKLGIRIVANVIKQIAAHGAELNALIALVKWTEKGFEMIREAHERGDQEARIDLYADAYAYAFLLGESGGGQASLRAVTPEEREAVALGKCDGAEAAGSTGELAGVVGKALLEQYGDVEHAARYIKSHVLKRAGLGGQAMARSGP
jgi:hypothetical protein